MPRCSGHTILRSCLLSSDPSIPSQEGCLFPGALVRAQTTQTGGYRCPERGHQPSWAPGTEMNQPDTQKCLPDPTGRRGPPCPCLWLVVVAAGGRGTGGGAGLAHTEAPASPGVFPGTGLPFQPRPSLDNQSLAFQQGEAQRWAIPLAAVRGWGLFLGPTGR